MLKSTMALLRCPLPGWELQAPVAPPRSGRGDMPQSHPLVGPPPHLSSHSIQVHSLAW